MGIGGTARMLAKGATFALLSLAAPASAETINARYEIYTGGFNALGIQARAAVEAEAYGVDVSLKTGGFIDWLLRFSQKIEARGKTGNSVSPSLYATDGTFFGTRRSIRLDYRPDGRIEAHLFPPDDDIDRTPVTDEMKVGTIDPVSAFIAFNRMGASGGSPCNGRVPVFDGRRRFDIIFEDDGPGVVEKSHYSVFSGPALRCKFQMERIGGFQKNPRFNPNTPRISILYIARFGDPGLWLPVRLESDSTFGNVVGHIVEIDAPVRPLGRSVRPAS